MNIFGVILSILVIRVAFSKKTKVEKYINILSALVLMELFVNTGYFIRIGTYEILYSEFVLIVLVFYSISFLVVRPINKKLFFLGMIFISSIVLTEIILLVNPLNEPILRNNDYIIPEFSIYSLIISTRFLFFVVVAIASKSLIGIDGLHKVVNIVQKYGFFIVSLLYVEWVINNVLKIDLFRRIVSFVFGAGTYTVDTLLTRGNLHSIQGFMREPAHLSEGLFYYLLIIILSRMEAQKVHKIIFMTIPLILLSGSFSGILYIVALFVIYLSKNRITSCYTLGLVIVILVSLPFVFNSDLFQYYYSRLMNSLNILSNNQTYTTISSEGVRLNTIIHTFKAFAKRPLLGLGVGVPYSYGFLSVIVASIGSIGGILWFAFVFNFYGGLRINTKSVVIIVALLVVWNFTGNISVSYSIYILIVASLIGSNYLNKPINQKNREYCGGI